MIRILMGILAVLAMPAAGAATQPAGALVSSEFIFDNPPFPSCHASTIAQTDDALVAAWFGGTREGAADVGIWVSRNQNGHWSKIAEVATGAQKDGTSLPCWNPVLFQPVKGPLILFYKIGPRPRSWWGMMMTSKDGGVSWSPPVRLPEGMLGPTKDKPIQLADGSLLCGSSTEDHGGQIHFERTADLGATWTKTDSLNDGQNPNLIQPTLLDHGGSIQFLCRSKEQVIYQGWSSDSGKTWTTPAGSDLPNPNSGIDAVQLKDGRSLLVYNHSPTARSPLNVAISPDGKTWKPVLVLEDADAQFSYPAVIQTRDGLVHITYTWKRKNIRHAVLDPSRLE